MKGERADSAPIQQENSFFIITIISAMSESTPQSFDQRDLEAEKNYSSMEEAFIDVMGFELPESAEGLPASFLLPKRLTAGLEDSVISMMLLM